MLGCPVAVIRGRGDVIAHRDVSKRPSLADQLRPNVCVVDSPLEKVHNRRNRARRAGGYWERAPGSRWLRQGSCSISTHHARKRRRKPFRAPTIATSPGITACSRYLAARPNRYFPRRSRRQDPSRARGSRSRRRLSGSDRRPARFAWRARSCYRRSVRPTKSSIAKPPTTLTAIS